MRATFLLILLVPAFCFTVSANQTFTITIHANDYSITETKDGYHKIQMENFGKIGIPGKPLLPSKTFLVALPPGAEVVSIHPSGVAQRIDGVYKIKPSPIQLPKNKYREYYDEYLENATEEYNENFNTIYSSDKLYPSKTVQYAGMGNLRKWRFANVKFTPFQYHPKSGHLDFYKQMTITINYSIPSKDSEKWEKIQRTLADNKADEQAKTLFVNYKDATKWYTTPKIETDNSKGCIFGQKGRSQIYVIIVPDVSYYSSVLDYAIWKQTTLNDSVWIISADTIDVYFPAVNRVESIRNFLYYAYINHDAQYALLVGEIHDTPMLNCWPHPEVHDTIPYFFPIPTDYYYADLTGNWDSDGDGYYGEFGQDAVDFAPEIMVGRIPWSNPTIVEQICNKLKNFEQDTGTWKKWALMLGSMTFVSPDPVTDEARIMEAIKDSLLEPENWGYWRMYEKSGLDTSLFPCEDSLCQNNVVNEWSTYPYGYVNWSSHGDSIEAQRTIRVSSRDTTQNPPIFNVSNIPSLNDNYPSIVFSSACLTAMPEYNGNLGQKLIEHGSAGFIGATRACYGDTGNINWSIGGNTSYNCYFALHMMRYQQKIGDAVYNSKLYYHTRHDTVWRDYANLFDFNLYGDPAMIWQGYSPGVKEESVSSVFLRPSLFLSPNPARHLVTIQYNLPTHSKISVKIFDVAGRVIKTIIAGKKKAGIYTLYWGGRADNDKKVPAGIYFCKMQSEKITLTKKFTLIR